MCLNKKFYHTISHSSLENKLISNLENKLISKRDLQDIPKNPNFFLIPILFSLAALCMKRCPSRCSTENGKLCSLYETMSQPLLNRKREIMKTRSNYLSAPPPINSAGG